MGRSETARNDGNLTGDETTAPEERTNPSISLPSDSAAAAGAGDAVTEPNSDTNPGFSLPLNLTATGAHPEADPVVGPDVVGPDDRTQLFDGGADAAPARRPFRLTVIEGPLAGTRFPLTDDVVLGRSSENAVHLADSSVSRRHARLVRTADDTFTLSDLGSGNGTLVNGAPVQEIVIRHGDTLTLGDSVLRLVDGDTPEGDPLEAIVADASKATPAATPDDTPDGSSPTTGSAEGSETVMQERTEAPPTVMAPAATPPQGTPSAPASGSGGRMKVYLAVAVVLVGFFAAAALLRQRSGGTTVTADGVEVVLDEAEALKREGLELARARKWPEAVKKFEEARAERSDAEIERLLTGSKVEAAHQTVVEDSRRLLSQGRFLQVRTRLVGVPETADYYPEARELIDGIASAMAQTVAAARERFDAGDREGALELVQRVLDADPAHVAANQLREEASRKPEPVVVAAPKTTPKTPVRTTPVEPVEVKPAAPAGPSPEAIAALLDGDVSRALRIADAADGAVNVELAKKLRAFDANFREGLTRVKNERYLEGTTPLTKALDLHDEITDGRRGKLGAEAGKQLANAHYLLGLDSKGDEQLPRAANHFRRALRADPSHELAKKQLDHVRSRANNLYIDAYTLENMDKDKARRLYRLVVATLVAGEETYDKAKRRLDSL